MFREAAQAAAAAFARAKPRSRWGRIQAVRYASLRPSADCRHEADIWGGIEKRSGGLASSLDQIGPLTKNVLDSALVLEAIVGYDENDATSLITTGRPLLKGLNRVQRDLGLPFRRSISARAQPKSRRPSKCCCLKVRKLGATVEEVSLPNMRYALPAYYVISSAEASSNLARFDGVKYGFRAEGCNDIDEIYKATRSEGFGREVKRRIMLGSFVLSAGYYDAYYKKALQIRTLICEDFNRVFERFDVILAPVAPTTAYKLGENSGNPLEMYMGNIYTVPINIAGLPSLSIPCGTDSQGLPIGMQLIGKPFAEPLLYQAAYAFEQSSGKGDA